MQKENENQAFLGLEIMKKYQKPERQFAICINTDDPDLLTPRMIYEVLSDESAEKSNYIRVIDNLKFHRFSTVFGKGRS